MELSEAFLCSPDPDSTLAGLQSTSTVRAYQYGSLTFYSSFAGNGSLWLSRHEFYTYAMVQSFYTCGITVQALDSPTVGVCSQAFFLFVLHIFRGGGGGEVCNQLRATYASEFL